MKRKTEQIIPDNIYTDVKRDLTPEQLAAIGAIALAWNGIEGTIDNIFGVVTELKPDIATDVISRINGFDGKTAVIRKAIETGLPFPEHIRKEIDLAIASAAECKVMRDSIIHAHVVNQDLGHGNAKRGSHYAVVLSQEALDKLYARIEATTSELIAVFWVIAFHKLTSQLPNAEGKAPFAALSITCAVRFRHFQKMRLALPPLPTCPDAPPTQIGLGDMMFQSLYRVLGSASPPPEMSDAVKAAIQQINDAGRPMIEKALGRPITAKP